MSNEERLHVADTVWSSLVREKKEGNVELFNTLLKSYVYNGNAAFEPYQFYLNFLKSIRSPGPTSNTKTFYYILLAYCQRGDIENALKILSLLKEKELPVTEEYFNALILGNGRSG